MLSGSTVSAVLEKLYLYSVTTWEKTIEQVFLIGRDYHKVRLVVFKLIAELLLVVRIRYKPFIVHTFFLFLKAYVAYVCKALHKFLSSVPIQKLYQFIFILCSVGKLLIFLTAPTITNSKLFIFGSYWDNKTC